MLLLRGVAVVAVALGAGARPAAAQCVTGGLGSCDDLVTPDCPPCHVPLCCCQYDGPGDWHLPISSSDLPGIFPGDPPEDPLGGDWPLMACTTICVEGSSGGDVDCGFDPPPGGPLAFAECGGEVPPLLPPVSCPDEFCDPPESDAGFDPWNASADGDLPGVSAECQRAGRDGDNDFEAACFADLDDSRPDAYLELLLHVYGSLAQVACVQTGSVLCQDGAFCQIRSNGTWCTRCDDNGDCHRFRSNEGTTAPDDVPTEEPLCTDADCDDAVAGTRAEIADHTVDVFCSDHGCDYSAERVSFDTPEGHWAVPYAHFKEEPSAPPEPSGDTAARAAERAAERAARDAETAAERAARQHSDRVADGHGGDEPVPPSSRPTAPISGDPDDRDRREACVVAGGHRCLQTLERADGKGGTTYAMPPQRELATPPGRGPRSARTAGDPVDVATGQLVDDALDLELAAQHGDDGLHFALRRHYASGGLSQGFLGRNWWHDYEERVVAVNERYPGVEDLPAYCVSGLPTIHCIARQLAPGRDEIYVQDPATLVFHPPPGGTELVRRDTNPADATSYWVMRGASGTMTGFDERGRLRWRRDRAGNAMYFWYGEDDGDQLRAVVDPLQRVIRFEYDDATGMLARVVDFAGREVRYGYRTVERVQLPAALRNGLGLDRVTLPGFYVRQYLLETVTRTAPETDVAPARSERWEYGYLTEAQIYAADALGEPPRMRPAEESDERCETIDSGLRARVEWELQVDHLIGNLQTVRNPVGDQVLVSIYRTDPNAADFDRVIWQSYGDDAATVDPAQPSGIHASYTYRDHPPDPLDPLGPDDVPLEVADLLDGTLGAVPAAASCEASWKAHDGRIVGFDPAEPSTAWPLGLDEVAATAAARGVCRFTRFVDRRGVATWFGTNFMGQALLEAQRRLDDEGGGWRVTRRQYDFAGRLTAEQSPAGQTRFFGYDAASMNPMSRNNLLTLTEWPAPSGPVAALPPRLSLWRYEPLFNQPLIAVDALDRATLYTYDFQELDAGIGEDMIVAYLRAWGSSVRAVDAVVRDLLGVGDANGDGVFDRVHGDRIAVREPDVVLASGELQPHGARFRHNDFGQTTRIESLGGRSLAFTYYPANLPTGAAVEQSSRFLDAMPAAQRSARATTGGLIATVGQTLVQPQSGVHLAMVTSSELATRQEYDLLGQLRRTLPAWGGEERVDHDGFGQVVRRVDGAGFEQRYAYDAVGRLVLAVEGLADGPVSLAGGGNARRTHQRYSTGGNLLARCTELAAGACDATDATALAQRRAQGSAAVITTLAYDAEDHLVATTDAEGHTATVTPDSRGLPMQRTAGGGLEPQQFVYDDDGAITVTWNAVGDSHLYDRDGFGRVTADHRPDGSAVHYTWDRADRLATTRVVDRDGVELASTRYDHDAQDRVWRAARRWTVPAGQLAQREPAAEAVIELELAEDGQPTAVIDARGAVTEYGYDSLGELEAVHYPGGDAEYTYRDITARRLRHRRVGVGHDLLDHTVIDGRGQAVATHVYDQVSGEAHHTSHAYDGLGSLTESIDAQGNRSTWAYDLAGRPIAAHSPADETGAPVRTTTFVSDRRGLVTGIADPAGVFTGRVYDAAGRLAAEVAGDRGTTLLYDPAGQPRNVLRSNGAQWALTWNAGQLDRVDAWHPDDGWAARVFVHDGLGRITDAVSYAPGDAVYRVVASHRVYDSLDHLLEEGTRVDSDPELTVRYAWDAGVIRSVRYPDGGDVERNLDDRGRVIAVDWSGAGADRHAAFAWQDDRLAGQTLDVDGVRRLATAIGYDYFGRPIASHTSRGAALVFDDARGYDPAGRVRQVTQRWGIDDGDAVARSLAFEYDGGGALAALWSADEPVPLLGLASNADVASDGPAHFPGGRRRFERDAVGSLLAERDDQGTWFEATSATPDNHQLAEILAPAGTDVAYDGAGRVTTDGRSDFIWTALDNLASATDVSSGDRTLYAYDAFGRRVARFLRPLVGPAAVERFVHDGWDRIAVYRDGVEIRRAVFGPEADHPVEIEVDGAPYALVRDLQGSVVAIVDDDGATVERYAYDGAGAMRVIDGTGAVVCEDSATSSCQPLGDHGYAGQLRDPETGLYHARHRAYSPALRRFLSPDPLGMIDGFDVWAYAGGDPINHTDPSGLSAVGRGKKPVPPPAPAPPPGPRPLIVYAEGAVAVATDPGEGAAKRYKTIPLRASRNAIAAKLRNLFKLPDAEVVAVTSVEQMKRVLANGPYTRVITITHGITSQRGLAMSSTSAIDDFLSPEALVQALRSGGLAPPARVEFFGCDTSASGFAQAVSNLLQGDVTVVGNKGGAKIELTIEWQSRNNIQFRYDIIESNPRTFKNAGPPLPVGQIDTDISDVSDL